MTNHPVFEADERQELVNTARRLAEHAGIMSDALHARFEYRVADQLLVDWWRMMIGAVALPNLSALTDLLSDDDA